MFRGTRTTMWPATGWSDGARQACGGRRRAGQFKNVRVLIQFFKAYAFRSERLSTFVRPFANRWLNLAIFWELLMLAAVLYWPLLQKPFKTHAMTGEEWLWALVAALSIVPAMEIGKWAARRWE